MESRRGADISDGVLTLGILITARIVVNRARTDEEKAGHLWRHLVLSWLYAARPQGSPAGSLEHAARN
jgi:hypothetical protein